MPNYTSDKLTTPDGAVIEYVEIGSGTPILLIPGGGDGVRTVCTKPYPAILARMFRRYAKDHRLIIMSRREPIPAQFTIEDFAKDYLWAMDQLGVKRMHVETNSAGGSIGQWIAANHPERAMSLVLGETMAHVDEPFRAILEHWIELVNAGQWTEFHRDSIRKTFAPRRVRYYRMFFPFLRFMKNPADPTRITRVLSVLLDLDNRPILGNIQCPTLVIGGDLDLLTRPELQREMAELIPNARQVIIPGTGHGENQEELRKHERYVLDFYREVEKA